MRNISISLEKNSNASKWMTIQEAIELANNTTSHKLTGSDIYRYALYGDICLSIYFQSPIVLRKIQTINNKIKLRPVGYSLINQLCLLAPSNFVSEQDLILCTEGRYFIPKQQIIDTPLTGYEYVIIQRLLADSLQIPLPVIGANGSNYGISVAISGEIFQIFEKVTWQERINKQIMNLPMDISPEVHEKTLRQCMNPDLNKDYFPIYELPHDSCFVIKHSELEKLIDLPSHKKILPASPTRISTPLSRLFWLACKNNETISPLIKQPYKLLSIFEQWASNDGITDHLSGDTLKTALERGSPESL